MPQRGIAPKPKVVPLPAGLPWGKIFKNQPQRGCGLV